MLQKSDSRVYETIFIGKGESIWDKFAHDRGGDNGENTCDVYYRAKDEDVSYLKKLKV